MFERTCQLLLYLYNFIIRQNCMGEIELVGFCFLLDENKPTAVECI